MKEKRTAGEEVKVRLTEAQHAALWRIKEKTGQTITAIIRNYVIAGLEQEENRIPRERAGEWFRRMGKIKQGDLDEYLQAMHLHNPGGKK